LSSTRVLAAALLVASFTGWLTGLLFDGIFNTVKLHSAALCLEVGLSSLQAQGPESFA